MIDCRGDFPILGQRVYGKPLAYLDSAATAQKPEVVIRAVDEIHRATNANIHRGVHHLAEITTESYEIARQKVAHFIGASASREVIFTAGATSSLNLAAASLCEMLLKSGDNIVLSRLEHHSNIVPWQIQCQRRGAEIRVIELDDDGALIFDPTLIDERTKIVAVAEASNVLGTMPDLEPIIARAHQVGAVVVVDGCQGVVHSGVNVEQMGCDFYAFSGHKLYGPTGIGVLYGKEKWLEKMEPWQGGGDMIASVSLSRGSTWGDLPLKFEAGTPNFIGAIGLGVAVDYVSQFAIEDIVKHESDLYNLFAEELMQIDGARIYGTTVGKSPICSFTIDGTQPVDLAMIADKMGVAMRSGQLCAEPTMERYGVRTMCRASFAMYNNQTDCHQAIEAITRAVKMLK
ncbi:MAG: SufS family cysteine desulfurase [Mucinivorans sp.]